MLLSLYKCKATTVLVSGYYCLQSVLGLVVLLLNYLAFAVDYDACAYSE
jgi:hypothetical protein